MVDGSVALPLVYSPLETGTSTCFPHTQRQRHFFGLSAEGSGQLTCFVFSKKKYIYIYSSFVEPLGFWDEPVALLRTKWRLDEQRCHSSASTISPAASFLLRNTQTQAYTHIITIKERQYEDSRRAKSSFYKSIAEPFGSGRMQGQLNTTGHGHTKHLHCKKVVLVQGNISYTQYRIIREPKLPDLKWRCPPGQREEHYGLSLCYGSSIVCLPTICTREWIYIAYQRSIIIPNQQATAFSCLFSSQATTRLLRHRIRRCANINLIIQA